MQIESPNKLLYKSGIVDLAKQLEALKYPQANAPAIRALTAPTNDFIDVLVFEIGKLDRLTQARYQELCEAHADMQLAHLLSLPDGLSHQEYQQASQKFLALPDSRYFLFLKGQGVIDEDHQFHLSRYAMLKPEVDAKFKTMLAAMDPAMDADQQIEQFFHTLAVQDALTIAAKSCQVFDALFTRYHPPASGKNR